VGKVKGREEGKSEGKGKEGEEGGERAKERKEVEGRGEGGERGSTLRMGEWEEEMQSHRQDGERDDLSQTGWRGERRRTVPWMADGQRGGRDFAGGQGERKLEHCRSELY
jgi:hypothetical protein